MWYNSTGDLEQHINKTSVWAVVIAAVVLVSFTLYAVWASRRLPKKRFKRLKVPLFLVMAGSVVLSTAVLAFNTVYLNLKAESKGPVHWHSDIEFWACGSEIELRDPSGVLSNKIGTSTYHEHNDKRIHLEGVVVDKKRDASLTKFMQVTGGSLTDQSIGIPLNKDHNEWLATADHQDGDGQDTSFQASMDGYVGETDKGPVLQLQNGEMCGSVPAELQVFVYRFDKSTKTYQQTKLTRPTDYIMRDESVIPPGDCVIVDFDQSKSSTDRICEQYGIRDAMRCEKFGVKKYEPKLCNIHRTEEDY